MSADDHASSTQTIPEISAVPRHVCVIMDGNGRWARGRFMPRVAGHKRGVEAVRATVKACREFGVEYLTLFAFSSENWRRPADEVTVLMQLFLKALESEVAKLHENDIRFRVVGDLTPFDAKIREHIARGEELTRDNAKLTLTVAVNYGGRWDVMQAANRAIAEAKLKVADPRAVSAENSPKPAPIGDFDGISEADLSRHLSMSYAPEPDLFIRTGGEKRISNFLLWQLAYTELYFTDELWPDFNRASLLKAIESYQCRERRFGRTSEQVQEASAPNVTAAE
jgi:undecaprenyl diphosphate synthase